MAHEFLHRARHHRVELVTLDRPDARNALSTALQQGLTSALSDADDDPEVDAVVLTGADPAFCAGLDLKEATGRLTGLARVHGNPAALLRAMRTPVIAAVNGPCIAGGLELALSCDFAVASDRAVFADTHAQLGLISGWGLSALLGHAVGTRRAKELSATGNRIGADIALAIGLVNHVVAHDQLLPFALEVADQITKSDRRAVAGMFGLYDLATAQAIDPALRAERLALPSYLRRSKSLGPST
jgi:enoyl-CoA hydratase